jgi:hypothetical protein
MNNQAYFTASSIQTMQQHLNTFGVKVNYDKHKDANVLILLHTGVYLLSSVKAPNRSCSTYLSDKDSVVNADVEHIMKVCQQSVCWCEI